MSILVCTFWTIINKCIRRTDKWKGTLSSEQDADINRHIKSTLPESSGESCRCWEPALGKTSVQRAAHFPGTTLFWGPGRLQ